MRRALLSLIALLPMLCLGQASEIPLERKVARMIILGFRGVEVSDSSQIVCDIRDRGIGGVILFEHNIAQPSDSVDSRESLRNMCTKLQSISPEKLIISIDQEGGRVNRLKTKYGFVESVTAQYLGEIDCEDSSRYYYRRMAEQLKDIGFNVNFAPDVDLNINPQCPAIGVYGRSYGSSARTVSHHAKFFIEEHHRSGIKTAIKHFPGHGSSVKDSHLGFTDITRTWRHKELTPYRYLINHSLCDMVMVSHTFNSDIDPVHPATLSRLTIDSLLRGKLDYDGIVITDDMDMKAISANYTFEQAMALTINAGADMIIISNNIKDSRTAEQIIGTIVALVEQGTITKERIDESYNRIMNFKQFLNP